MAKRTIGRVREVSNNIEDYSYFLNGIGGVGKTTTVCEIGQKLFGVGGYLHLTVGEEPKPEHIGNLWSDVAEEWDDFEEIIEALCENKDEGYVDDNGMDYSKLKMVGLDSADEIIRLAENKVIELHNKKVSNPSDKVDTIKKCFGGFQAGENKVVDMVVETIFMLRKHNICPFIIGHTKPKNKKDLMTDIEYEQITSNLDNKYYTAIKDKVSMVMCAYIEREMTDLETMKDAFTKKQKQVGKIASEKRVISFRDEEHAIDLKSHLKYICPKCDLDSDLIIKELKEAIKKQSEIYNGGNNESKPLKEEIVIEKPKREIKKPVVDESKIKEEKIEQIKNNLAKLDMAKLQTIMIEYSITNFENPSDIKMEALDKILALI